MVDVARALEIWIEGFRADCAPSDAVVVWARPYGSDFVRAWRECPRADFLAALGALVRVDTVVLRRILCALGSQLLSLVEEEHRARLEPLVALALAWTRGRDLSTTVIRDDVAEALRTSIAAEERLEVAAVAGLEDRLSQIVSALRGVGRGRAFATLEQELGDGGDLAALRALHTGRHRRNAATLVMRALHSLLVYGKLADSAVADRMLVVTQDGRFGPRTLRDAEVRLESIDDALYACAASFYVTASRAHGWHEGGKDATFRVATKALAQRCADGSAFDDPLASVRESIALTMAARVAAVQSRFAETFRDEMARALVCEDETQNDVDPDELLLPARDVGRDRMHDAFVTLGRLAATIEHAPLVDAVDAVLLVLRAPGNLHRPTVVSLVAHVHERLAEMFRERACLADDADGARWRETGRRIERQMEAHRSWLARSGTAPLD